MIILEELGGKLIFLGFREPCKKAKNKRIIDSIVFDFFLIFFFFYPPRPPLQILNVFIFELPCTSSLTIKLVFLLFIILKIVDF